MLEYDGIWTCLKELMLTKLISHAGVLFVIISFLKQILDSSKKACNGCHDLMQKAMSSNDNVVVYVKGNNYRIHFWYVSKDKTINIKKNSDLKCKS